MAGIKSFVLFLTVAMCGYLSAGCNENPSAPDTSSAELKKVTAQLAQAEKDRDSAKMVLKAVRREAEKLKTDLEAAQSTMRGALNRLKPLENEIAQLKQELAKLKPPEKGAPRPATQPK
ncbi:MAG: hypothetical protein ISS69_08095 [Phycisphaerae bacterium]|nr:hypothetical protein [Planctomycetota bacterium]MBL7220060.1 hypothetical protein [Phycisphaerae bacterium]